MAVGTPPVGRSSTTTTKEAKQCSAMGPGQQQMLLCHLNKKKSVWDDSLRWLRLHQRRICSVCCFSNFVSSVIYFLSKYQTEPLSKKPLTFPLIDPLLVQAKIRMIIPLPFMFMSLVIYRGSRGHRDSRQIPLDAFPTNYPGQNPDRKVFVCLHVFVQPSFTEAIPWPSRWQI